MMLQGLVVLAALTFGKEIALSAPQTGLVPRVYDSPQVVSNGEDFFAVWNDARTGSSELFGTRIDENGLPLDPLGILISPYISYGSEVVWNGERYLVAGIADSRVFTDTVLFVVVAANGKVEDEGIAVQERRPFNAVHLATNDNTTLLVTRYGSSMLFDRRGRTKARFSLPGNVLWCGVASASTGRYLVAGFDYDKPELVLQDVAADGRIGARTAVPVSVAPRDVAIASDGGRFLVAWTSDRLHWRLFSDAGAAIGDEQINGVDPLDYARYFVPAVVWRGTEFLITYQHGNAAKAVRTNGGAAVGSPMPFGTVSYGRVGLAAAKDGRGVATWLDSSQRVTAARFDPPSVAAGLPFFDAHPIVYSAYPQTAPQLVPSGNTLFAVWDEQLPDGVEVRASRGGAIPVPLDIPADKLRAFAADGGDFWAAWVGDDNRVFARRFDLDFQPRSGILEESSERVDGFARSLSVAAHDGVLVAVFPNAAGDIVATRIERDVAATTLLSTSPLPESGPDVMWNGAEFVVAWLLTERPINMYPKAGGQIMARRIAHDGSPVDPQPVPITNLGTQYSAPKLAAAPDGVAIFWEWSAAFFNGAALPVVRYTGFGPRNATAIPGGYALLNGYLFIELDTEFRKRRTDGIDFGNETSGVSMTAVGNQLVFGYARIGEAVPYGRVPRAFVRGLPPSPPRRRTAEH